MNAVDVTPILASRNTASKSVIFTFEVEFEKTSFLRKLFNRPPQKSYRYCTGTALYEVLANLMDSGLGYDSLVSKKIFDFMRLTRNVFWAVDKQGGRLSADTLNEVGRLLGSRCNDVFKTYSPNDWHIPLYKGQVLEEHCALATEGGWERKNYRLCYTASQGGNNASGGTTREGQQGTRYPDQSQRCSGGIADEATHATNA